MLLIKELPENPYKEYGITVCENRDVVNLRPAQFEAVQKYIDSLKAQEIKLPKIVCLSGSTRFTNEMLILTWNYAKQGVIALGWCVLPTNHNPDGTEIDHHLAEKEGVAEILDELHLRKIDMPDEVFVVNVGGYIGDGTKREIKYAIKVGKPVKFLEPEWSYHIKEWEKIKGGNKQ